METYRDLYEQYSYLVTDSYDGYIDNDFNEEAAADRTIYELNFMIKDEFSKAIIYIDLCYLFSIKKVTNAFFEIYIKIIDDFNRAYVKGIEHQLSFIGDDEILEKISIKAKAIDAFADECYKKFSKENRALG